MNAHTHSKIIYTPVHTKAYIQICQTLLTIRCENTDWYQWMSTSTECSIYPWNGILCGHDKGRRVDTLQPQLRKQVKLKKTAWKTTCSRIPITHTAQNRETQRTELLPRLGNTHKWRTTTSRQKAWGFVVFFFWGGWQILDSGKLYNLVNTEYSFLKGAVSSHVTLQFSFDIFFFDLYCGANGQRAAWGRRFSPLATQVLGLKLRSLGLVAPSPAEPWSKHCSSA